MSGSTTVEIILYYLTETDFWDLKERSTTVEIILYYLTKIVLLNTMISTTVEIILYYLTISTAHQISESTTVEIILYYLTTLDLLEEIWIYNSRNYSILLNHLP